MCNSLLVVCTISLLLGGCASVFGEANPPTQLKGSGISIPAPYQWQVLCKEHPELEICKPEVKP